jgi:thioredoxin 1
MFYEKDEMTMGKFTFEVTRDNFQEQVLNASLPVLVDYWATWCPPCKMIEPSVEEIARKYQGQLLVGKVDVDQYPELQEMFDVWGIPTQILFQNGQPVQRIVGFKPLTRLEADLLPYLNRVKG